MNAAERKPAERRRSDLRDHKRKSILAAARRVCDAGGPEALTMRAVAAEAGYAPGAVYSYFAGIDELAIALTADELGHLARRMREAAERAQENKASPAAALEAAAQEALKASAGNAPHIRLAGRLMSAEALPAELDRAVTGRVIAILETLGGPLRATTGLEGAAAHREILCLAALLIGLRVLDASGRLGPLGFSAEGLLGHHLSGLPEA
ncbi:helix-turn-helix domain-containing protein [Parvibaculum sp.]|uniref:TetR/AcrR family transcriptional regulator n=1 Tax=Parvibaculum sp. TaxID=2024848 RepID=UPI001AFD3ABE|nr:helix-turn-helix domain-containing protein [Parvibaculum sp.]MBO6666746.1 TetR/AcrR family transcriptional regulator [Parvibaculum sp.]MBO6693689.1 TetR/AcrR family transcriptional regulator [Parvibaculum sp.]MBO6713367.1 TetR/AcrR family transcriptional regulator [Parvibaculum sp.]